MGRGHADTTGLGQALAGVAHQLRGGRRGGIRGGLGGGVVVGRGRQVLQRGAGTG